MKGRSFIFVIVLIIIFFIFRSDNSEIKHIEKTMAFIKSFGYVSFFIYILFCISASFIFIPLSITRLIGIMIFGPLWGSILNVTGITSGAILSFFLSRYVFSKYFIERFKTNAKYNKINEAVEKHGVMVLIGTRLNPFFSNTIQNFLYGVTDIKVSSYILWTVFLYGIGTAFMALWIELATTDNFIGRRGFMHTALILISILFIIIIFIILKKKSLRKR